MTDFIESIGEPEPVYEFSLVPVLPDEIPKYHTATPGKNGDEFLLTDPAGIYPDSRRLTQEQAKQWVKDNRPANN